MHNPLPHGRTGFLAHLRLALWIAGVLSGALGLAATAATLAHAAAGNPVSPTEILQKTLDHRYGYDFVHQIRLVQRDRFGEERETRLEMAQKNIQSKLHALVRFTYPESLRGTRVLSVEAEGRSDDHFAYLRSQQRVRRVRSTRKDSFMGTDFTMEDMERREVSDFRVAGHRLSQYHDEDVHLLELVPVYESGYAQVRYVVSARDFCTLAILYFKEGAEEPFKEFVSPRESIRDYDGVLIGTHAYIRNLRSQTETHIYLEQVVINPDLDDNLFRTAALVIDRDLPGIE